MNTDVAAATFKRRLLDAPKPLQRRYVRGLVSDIVVNRERVVITGPQSAVAAAITSGALETEGRSSVREWRTRQDSNLRPSPSEGDTLSS